MEKIDWDCNCNIIHPEAVAEAKAAMLSGDALCALSNIFKLLGDPTRMKLVWALNHREMCVCDLAATLGMTKSAVSHQLKTMREGGIVKARREGKNVFYSLYDQHVTDIMDLAQAHTSHA